MNEEIYLDRLLYFKDKEFYKLVFRLENLSLSIENIDRDMLIYNLKNCDISFASI